MGFAGIRIFQAVLRWRQQPQPHCSRLLRGLSGADARNNQVQARVSQVPGRRRSRNNYLAIGGARSWTGWDWVDNDQWLHSMIGSPGRLTLNPGSTRPQVPTTTVDCAESVKTVVFCSAPSDSRSPAQHWIARPYCLLCTASIRSAQ